LYLQDCVVFGSGRDLSGEGSETNEGRKMGDAANLLGDEAHGPDRKNIEDSIEPTAEQISARFSDRALDRCIGLDIVWSIVCELIHAACVSGILINQ